MKRFNVRVYGVYQNEHGEIVLSSERRNGYSFVKFPGGGLEFGEGTADALKREWKEEWNLDIEVGKLLYVNDFLQVSAFNPEDQVLSFYYEVKKVKGVFPESISIETQLQEDGEHPVWVKREDLSARIFTFLIDKVVGELLMMNDEL